MHIYPNNHCNFTRNGDKPCVVQSALFSGNPKYQTLGFNLDTVWIHEKSRENRSRSTTNSRILPAKHMFCCLVFFVAWNTQNPTPLLDRFSMVKEDFLMPCLIAREYLPVNNLRQRAPIFLGKIIWWTVDVMLPYVAICCPLSMLSSCSAGWTTSNDFVCPAFRRLNPKNGSQTPIQLSRHYMEVF